MAKAKYTMNARGEYATRIWDGTYNQDGSKHRINLKSTKSSADLERQVNVLKESVKQGAYVQSSDICFGQYADQWLRTKKSVREENTRAMYRNIIEKHLYCLSAVKLSDIRNSHFQLVISKASDKPRTCQQIYITFKQIIGMAVVDNLIGEGSARKIISDINLPKYVRKEKRPLNEIKKQALKTVQLSDMDEAFVTVLLYLGLRRGEALALTKFDFDFKKGIININKTIIFKGNDTEVKPYTKSQNGMRTLPIPSAALEALKLYILSLNSPCLFYGQSGSVTLSMYRKMWGRIIDALNTAAGGTKSVKMITGLTAHIFRHNYCSNLCYQVPAISIKKIAQLLGDTEKVVIDVYNHVIDEKEDVQTVVNNALAL